MCAMADADMPCDKFSATDLEMCGSRKSHCPGTLIRCLECLGWAAEVGQSVSITFQG